MKSSKMLLISAFITAAILTLIGGATTIVLANKNTAEKAAAPQMVQRNQQQEASYNALLQQANAQIEKANADLQAMQKKLDEMKQSQGKTAPAPASASVTISPSQAHDTAQKAAAPGQQATGTPDLIEFEGKTAYEVVFPNGSIYVDAVSGAVLFNGTVPQVITADKAGQIASDYLKIRDILFIDKIVFHNADLYRVVFKNGTMAYLDMTGQIKYVQLPEKKKVVIASSSGGTQGSGTSASSEQEDPADGN